VQHDFVWIPGRIVCITFAPIVAHSVSKYVSVPVECCGGDATSDFRISLEPVFRIFVPEVKCTVGPCRAECPMYRMEGNSVNGEHLIDVSVGGIGLTMAFEAEIGAVLRVSS
jgi:hypothetical protein